MIGLSIACHAVVAASEASQRIESYSVVQTTHAFNFLTTDKVTVWLK